MNAATKIPIEIAILNLNRKRATIRPVKEANWPKVISLDPVQQKIVTALHQAGIRYCHEYIERSRFWSLPSMEKMLGLPVEKLRGIRTVSMILVPKLYTGQIDRQFRYAPFPSGSTDDIEEPREGHGEEVAGLDPLPSIPSACSLIGVQEPQVRDQGGRETCVAFAVCHLAEQDAIRTGHPSMSNDLSEQHSHFLSKNVDGLPPNVGTHPSVGFAIAAASGLWEGSIWPYIPSAAYPNNHGSPIPGTPISYFPRTATRLADPKDILRLKVLLASGCRVAVSIEAYDFWYYSADAYKKGLIRSCYAGSGKSLGCHMIVLVGYQDDPIIDGGGSFVFRNSWGIHWASEGVRPGYGDIDYKYVQHAAKSAYYINHQNQGSRT